MKVIHNIKPIYNKNSKILILGSMPSVKSREEKFYYAHKTNKFWKIINILFNVNLNTVEEKMKFLIENNIAIWDTIKSCEIKGSKDSSIKNIKVNNIQKIIKNSNIKHIFCIGNTSYNVFVKNIKTSIPITKLPSTSSANAKYKIDDLVKKFKLIKEILEK